MDYRTQVWTRENSQRAVEGIWERDIGGLGVKGGSSGHGEKRKNSSWEFLAPCINFCPFLISTSKITTVALSSDYMPGTMALGMYIHMQSHFILSTNP